MKTYEDIVLGIQAAIRESAAPKDIQAPEVEEGHKTYQFRHPDVWHMQLFVGVCRSFGIQPVQPNPEATVNSVKCEATFFKEVVMAVFVDASARIERLINELMEQSIEDVASEIIVEPDETS